MKNRIERFRRLVRGNLVPLIRVIDGKLEKKLNAELKPLDITFSQARVIGLLCHSGCKSFSMKELEEIFQVSQQTMAGIVRRLEEKELVSGFADADDKRVKRICLTGKGRQFNSETAEKMEEMDRWIARVLSEEEIQTLVDLLQKLYHNLDN